MINDGGTLLLDDGDADDEDGVSVMVGYVAVGSAPNRLSNACSVNNMSVYERAPCRHLIKQNGTPAASNIECSDSTGAMTAVGVAAAPSDNGGGIDDADDDEKEDEPSDGEEDGAAAGINNGDGVALDEPVAEDDDVRAGDGGTTV